MRFTREFMLDRMRANDAGYDGRFVVGVHSTGIYCLPSCRARLPKPENVRFYRSFADARDAGLRACKRCRPDEWERGIDEARDRLTSTIERMWAAPGEFKSVDDLANAAMMSPSAFFTAVRESYHTTPGTLLAEARVEGARHLLRHGQEVGATGLEVGFDSTSAFYENFRRRVGMPPAAYRKLNGKSSFELDLPDGFRLDPFFSYLGRDPQSRTERQVPGGVELALWTSEKPLKVILASQGKGLRVCLDEGADAFEVHIQVSRMLGLESDPRPFEDHVRSLGLERLVDGREGLRLPQTANGFDGMVWCIVGQQVNLTFAFTLRRRLAELMNVEVPGGLLAPPTPQWLAERTVDELMPLQFSGRKAEYLIGAARAVCDGTLDFQRLARLPRTEAEKILLSRRGIGPWAANYLLMRALAAPDCLPIGDTGITSALARFFDVPRPGPQETAALMEPFRPYRSLACYHLWKSLQAEAL